MINSWIIRLVVLVLLESYGTSQVATYCDFNQAYGYCRDKTISMIGDFNVAVTIGIHQSSDGRVCDRPVSISGFQAAIALEWITSILNEGMPGNDSYVPDVKFGYAIYDDCGVHARTSSYLTNAFHRTSLTRLRECASNCSLQNHGILKITTHDSSVDVMDMAPPEIPLININAIRNAGSEQLSQFYITDDMQLEINDIFSFLSKYSWNFISVVYTTDSIGLNYQSILQDELTMNQGKTNSFCFLYMPTNGSKENVSSILTKIITEQFNFAENETFGILFLGGTRDAAILLETIKEKTNEISIAKKVMVMLPSCVSNGTLIRKALHSMQNHVIHISPQRLFFDSFKSYFHDVITSYYTGNAKYLDPWISKYVTTVCNALGKTKCSLGELNSAFIQETIVDKTVIAMLSLAASLKTIHDTYCWESPENCTEFQNHLNETAEFLKKSLKMDEGLEARLRIDGYNLKLGFYRSNSISVGRPCYTFTHFKDGVKTVFINCSEEESVQTLMPAIPASLCKSDRKSVRCLEQQPLKYGYTHGDVLILGLFSIHQDAYTMSQNNETFFQCGNFRQSTTAVVTVSAFLESVKTLGGKTDIPFGAIALDDCYNELNISALLTELFTKRRVLRDQNTNIEVDFDKVIAVVGALSSRVTQPIADMMTSLHIPMVSYGASSITLDNRIRYPYFMRTVPSDALQIKGIITLLSKLNVNHVGALYIDDAYGASGNDGILSLASKNGICVTNSTGLTADSTSAEIIQVLKEKNQYKGVKVIVMFTIDTVVKKILGDDVLGDENDKDMSAYAPVFISSEGWGTDPELANKESVGSLIFTTDSSKRVDDSFGKFLRSISFGNVTENPWLYRYFEEKYKCNLKTSFEKFYDNDCRTVLKLDEGVINNLSNEQRIVHAELAVHAIGRAYQAIKTKGVGQSCFERNKACARGWSRAIKDIEIPILDGSSFRPFKSDGNGNLGFTIHNVQKETKTTFSYVKVGTYNDELSLQTDKLQFYNHLGEVQPLAPIDCPRNKCQNVCIITTSVPNSSPAMELAVGEVQTDTLTIVLGALAGMLFLVVILLIILVLRTLRGNNRNKEKQENCLQMDQLSVPVPTHHRSNRSLDGIYHEAHSIHSSFNDLRNVNHNKGFHENEESDGLAPPSSSSGIVAGSISGSASPGSRVVYSHMSQTIPKITEQNKYLQLESSGESNECLKALTKRVLGPNNNMICNKATDNDTKMIYLSANDLVMENDESPSASEPGSVQKSEIEQEPMKFDFTPPKDQISEEAQKVCVPPAYIQSPEVELVMRPVSLPGIQPFTISPQSPEDGILPNTERSSPNPHINLYTNDMYLMPVSDKLPTYEQHLKQQQLQKETKGNNGIMHTSSPIIYTNIKDCSPSHFANGKAINLASNQLPFSRATSSSPASSFGSQSASINSLSPVQKEALLNSILQENPSYFLNKCNKSKQYNLLPKSPEAKFKQQILNALENPVKQHTNGTVDLEDGEEVMI